MGAERRGEGAEPVERPRAQWPMRVITLNWKGIKYLADCSLPVSRASDAVRQRRCCHLCLVSSFSPHLENSAKYEQSRPVSVFSVWVFFQRVNASGLALNFVQFDFVIFWQ